MNRNRDAAERPYLLHLLRTPHSRARELQVALVLILFILMGTWHFRHVVGEDLSSSYVGCRIMAAGEGTHLYAHDPVLFSEVRDPVWDAIAGQASFSPLSLLHPYVQTPLWAYFLEPVCTRTTFPQFCRLFLLLDTLCAAGTLWLVTRYWTPVLYHPAWILVLCIALTISDPFRYAMYLAQTHILFIFLTVLGLILAQKDRTLVAGLALALAACVKVTPAFVVIYWLLSRRYKAAASFVGFSVLLVVLTILVTGPALFVAYLKGLSEVSNVLLVAFNNQSLAAWWMGRYYPVDELFNWRIYPLAPYVKWTSLFLSMLCGILGGLLDRDHWDKGGTRAPYGAFVTLVGCTMFNAIAWNHYYIWLIIPLAFLISAMFEGLPALWGALAIVIYVLNLFPIAYGSILHAHRSYSIVRSEFYSGAICLVALLLLRHLQSGGAATPSSTGDLELSYDPVDRPALS